MKILENWATLWFDKMRNMYTIYEEENFPVMTVWGFELYSHWIRSYTVNCTVIQSAVCSVNEIITKNRHYRWNYICLYNKISFITVCFDHWLVMIRLYQIRCIFYKIWNFYGE
jgi:hypothetical protein